MPLQLHPKIAPDPLLSVLHSDRGQRSTPDVTRSPEATSKTSGVTRRIRSARRQARSTLLLSTTDEISIANQTSGRLGDVRNCPVATKSKRITSRNSPGSRVVSNASSIIDRSTTFNRRIRCPKYPLILLR